MEYQNIKFGDVEIEGFDRYPEYRLVFPDKPEGKTILDIGCNLGYYCFQAYSEGATCVGIDNHSAFIESANDTKENLMLYDDQVNFIQTDVLLDEHDYGKFDVVLLLYVVHHFTKISDVKRIIQQCYDMANEVAVFGVLNPVKLSVSSQWLVNRKGNKKLALSDRFFVQMFPDNKIDDMYSTVDGRSIIKVWK
jgi:2-polyprenyl-3-methyl-5-hydroxy-6-metoxy-1,4-benzoquinol methylase